MRNVQINDTLLRGDTGYQPWFLTGCHRVDWSCNLTIYTIIMFL